MPKKPIARMHPTETQRVAALKMVAAGHTAREISELIGCSKSWVWGICQQERQKRAESGADRLKPFISQAICEDTKIEPTPTEPAPPAAEPLPSFPNWAEFTKLAERVAVLEAKLAPLLS